MSREKTVAVYAGSFDPFTIGHLDVLEKSSKIFDKVVLLFSVNSQKKRNFNAINMIKAVSIICTNMFDNVVVDSYNGLVAEYCKMIGCKYLVRGLRNTSDYLYEENIATINQEIYPELKTVLLRSSTNAISSSMVKELFKHSIDASKYLPDEVFLACKGELLNED